MTRRIFHALFACALAVNCASARPTRWCGWFMRHELGVADVKYDQACAWRNYGSPAVGPAVGVIVVWCSSHHRHVGRIVGGSPDHWIVRSGNDGHAIRERERRVADAVAFRWP